MIKKKARESHFVIIWEFRVRAGQRPEFERAYGSDGTWVKLFRTGKGYIRTELVRDWAMPHRYLTLDFWNSRQAYLNFRKKNGIEYQAIDEKCVSLTEREVKIGEFQRSS